MNEFLKDLHDKLDAKLGQDIVTIDFRGHSPLFDYMMIVSALNERNANSLADICVEVAHKHNQDIISVDNAKESGWLVVDLNDVVVHIFYDGRREFYDLEGLWKDLGILKM